MLSVLWSLRTRKRFVSLVVFLRTRRFRLLALAIVLFVRTLEVYVVSHLGTFECQARGSKTDGPFLT